jgi:glutathione S-transferase
MAAPILVVYALPGSQYVFKVLAAMASRKIDYYVAFCPMNHDERAEFINAPNGGSSVPVMKVITPPPTTTTTTTTTTDDDKHKSESVVITDSEEILKWFDQNQNQTKFFPTEETSSISRRADGTLAAMVWYYNWVNFDGYAKSMRIVTSRYVPFSRFLPNVVLDWCTDWLVSGERTKFRQKVKAAMKVNDEEDVVLDDEPQMRAKLVQELLFFQRLLLQDGDDTDQDYLIAGTTEPTAADFSVYAQLERLVGAGTASDIDIPASIQDLKDGDDESLARLWKWHDLMRERFPVQFKGKRPPKELLLSTKQSKL